MEPILPVNRASMLVICLNGPVNSGKSTVGRALAGLLPDAAFIDGDDHDAPPHAILAERIERALDRLERYIRECRHAYLVLAYPLRDADYERLRRVSAERRAGFFVATLALPLAVILSDRGARRLTALERSRIREMFAEGYCRRPFSDVFLTENEPADRIAARLAARIQRL